MTTSEPPTPGMSPPPRMQRRFPVSISAYVKLSFADEIELSGSIGPLPFAAESHSRMRTMTTKGSVGGESLLLRVHMRRLRPWTVRGEVINQEVRGTLTARGGTVVLEGQAGHEPLRYELDVNGACTNQARPLGVHILYQAFYSELTGSVDRVADAAMLALLLPVALHVHDRQAV